MRDGWVETTLGDIFKIVAGKYVAKEEYVEGGEFWIYGSNSVMGKLDRFLVEQSHVVMAAIGAYAGAVRYSKEPSWINNNAMALVPSEKVIAKYLHLWLESKFDLKRVVVGTGQPYVQRPLLLKEIIALPPLPEQKRIVDLISSVDSYIDALQQQLESAKRSRNAVLHKLLTVGKDDWEYKILSDICEVRDGTHDSPKPSDKGFALVTSKNIKDGRLNLEGAYLISPQDYEEVNKRSKVEQYNLLISMIGTIGEVIVLEGEPDFAIKNVGLLKSTEPILSRYLCHYLGSQLGKNAISLSVSGSTQKFISLGKLRALPVLYPPMEDQKAIVEAMSLFDQQISKNLEVAARIKNLRSSLLSDLLSGEHLIPSSYDKVMGAA